MRSAAFKAFVEQNRPPDMGTWSGAQLDAILGLEVGKRLIRVGSVSPRNGELITTYKEPEPFRAEAGLYEVTDDGRAELSISSDSRPLTIGYSDGYIWDPSFMHLRPNEKPMLRFMRCGLGTGAHGLWNGLASLEGAMRLTTIILELLSADSGKEIPPEYVTVPLPHEVVEIYLTRKRSGVDRQRNEEKSWHLECFDYEVDELVSEMVHSMEQLSHGVTVSV